MRGSIQRRLFILGWTIFDLRDALVGSNVPKPSADAIIEQIQSRKALPLKERCLVLDLVEMLEGNARQIAGAAR